jgi:hypothetical protein
MSICLCSIFLELDSVLELLFDVLNSLFGLFPFSDVLVDHLSVLGDSVLVQLVVSLDIGESSEEDTMVSVGVDFIPSHGQEIIDFVSQLTGTSDDLENVVLGGAIGVHVVSDK